MKKNLFCMWLLLLAILFSVNTQAQMTIGGKKEPEAFSVLELLNKGGLRLPQMTTAERNAFAVKNNDKGNGLTIYNKTTNCVEYWNATRWVSLCEGTSQTTISPQPCVNVAADGTGCDQTFTVDDVDCPDGPFDIAITGGGNYASLSDMDKGSGSFKINFNVNESINKHTVIVRVTSTCTGLFKEFLFSQNGVDCSSMPYAVPALSASSAVLCSGGSVYLSVPANTPNLDKLIWTRNGEPLQANRGLNYLVVTQTGKYNVSMGAAGCNTNAANEKNITDSGSAAPAGGFKIDADNDGVICGTNEIRLTAIGTATTIAWFHNGVEDKTKSGKVIRLSGDSSVGQWFAAVKDGECYSTQSSNTIDVTKSEASGSITLAPGDVLVNGVPLKDFTTFCANGSLNLSIANKQDNITYTWYNGNDIITTNSYVIPASQTSISLRMIATDNSGAKCPAQQSVSEAAVTQGNTPAKPTIITTSTLCNGKATLKILESGTYIWYKGIDIITGQTGSELIVDTEGVYGAAIKNASGCISPIAQVTISGNSDAPNIDWNSKTIPPTDAAFGSSLTLTVDNTYDSTYTWTMDGVKQSSTGKTGTIPLPASGTAGQKVKIAVTAKNECGEKTLEAVITMNNGCQTPVITAQPAAKTIIAKTSVTLSVSVKDTNAETYQWFRNTTDSTTGGTPVGSAPSYTTNDLDAGTYYFYCKVTNGCDGTPFVTSQTAKVTVNKNPADILPGSGSLNGKTCFDIVETNGDTNGCGTIASRSSMKADFTKTEEYTFTPQGTATNVHFAYVESALGTGKIVDKFETSGNKVTVTYKTTLSGPQGTAKGISDMQSLTVTIYAIFNDATGAEKAVQLKAVIKDCMCCGAMISPTVWKAFMCYNLGVTDQTLDPLSPNALLQGKLFMQGNKDPNSTVVNRTASWGGTGTKTDTDPCPPGYRVPTGAEWKGVVDYNPVKTWLGSGTNSGLKIGNNLMLPYIYAMNVSPVSTTLAYWSSTLDTVLKISSGQGQNAPSVAVWAIYNTPNARMGVRCISEN